MTSSLLFNLTTVAYFAAMVVFIIYLTSKNKVVGLVATLICWAGFIANTGGPVCGCGTEHLFITGSVLSSVIRGVRIMTLGTGNKTARLIRPGRVHRRTGR